MSCRNSGACTRAISSSPRKPARHTVPTVKELSDPYANFMVNPAPAGNSVCAVCRTFKGPSHTTCFQCSSLPDWLAVVVPVTYSVAHGQMHTALRGYKDGWGGDRSEALRNRFTVQLAAVLSRFLATHETCIATAAGTPDFDVVTTVPSSTPARENEHWRLRWIAEVGCSSIASRYRRLLKPTALAAAGKAYDAGRYESTERLDGLSVLLVDDTWTQGRSAQSACAALMDAGASCVALVVIGRHINPDWQVVQGEKRTNGDLLRAAPPWSWETCAVHAW